MSTAQLPGAQAGPGGGPATAPSTTPAGPGLRARLRPTGLVWLSWRQSRATVRVFGGLMLLAVLALAVGQVLIRRTMGTTDMLGWQLADYYGRYATRAVFVLPVLVGVFVGAPLLSQEHEHGTIRLARVQSVRPTRWLAARLALPALLVLVSVGALAAVSSWIWYDLYADDLAQFSPYPGLTYPALCLAPVAWSLYALALGAAIGHFLRRTLLAAPVTGAAVVLSQLLARATRVHFVPLADTVRPVWGPRNSNTDLGWVVQHGTVLNDGSRITDDACPRLWQECAASDLRWTSSHPVSHLIPMQLVEAALLALVAAAVLYPTFRRVARTAL
ncbi:hypothetical protein [Kitasatospora sp. NPDC057198]|uniref:hypothetical protein n=1 Tax=Kitasatospora sp. NPDC057198 TaxID=3346046 RepID=UPI00362C863A